MKGYIIHLFIYHSPLLVALFSLSGYRYLGDGGTDRREILHDGIGLYISVPDRSSPLLGAVAPREPQIQNFGPKFWPIDREYLENGKLKPCMSIEA